MTACAGVEGQAEVHRGVLTIGGQSSSFPNYKLLALLGCGANAAVVKALDERLDRIVALKVYAKVAQERDLRDKRVQALREIMALGRLEHPVIARARHAFLSQDHVVVAMDFYDAPTMRTWLTQEKEAVASTKTQHRSDGAKHLRRRRQRLLLHITDGLTHVYRSGGFHGDLHGNNVLVIRPPDPAYPHDSESPKLLDFGVSMIKETGESGKDLAKKDLRDLRRLAGELAPDLPWQMLHPARGTPLLYAQAVGALVTVAGHLDGLTSSVAFRREQDEWRQTHLEAAAAAELSADVDEDGLDARLVQDLVGLAHVVASVPAFRMDLLLRILRDVTQSTAAPDLLLRQVATFAELHGGSERKVARTTDPVLGRVAYSDLQQRWLAGTSDSSVSLDQG